MWVVATLVWVSAVFVFSWNDVSNLLVAVEPPEGSGAMVLGTGDYACWALKHSDNRFVFIDDEWGKRPKNATEATVTCAIHKAKVPALAILPPLFALLLGVASMWVLKGFRPTLAK